MSAPSACNTGTRQLFTNSPFMRTEQEPHSPSPQPSLVPVRCRSSRSTSSRRFIGGAWTSQPLPLMVKWMVGQDVLIGLPAPRLAGERRDRRTDPPGQGAVMPTTDPWRGLHLAAVYSVDAPDNPQTAGRCPGDRDTCPGP